MSHQEKDKPDPKLLDHHYDGIQELDNPLPGWWVQTFIWAIVFAFFYFLYYELGDGPSLQTELKHDMVPIEAAIQANKSKGFLDADVKVFVSNKEKMNAIVKPYQEKCASCHGNQAQGLIGPNLTDHFWINGDGTPKAIAKVIFDGSLEKGMPSWGALMSRDDVIALAAYLVTLKDSHPPQAKAAQGKEFP